MRSLFDRKASRSVTSTSGAANLMASAHFRELLRAEQRRTERSGRPFMLMRVYLDRILKNRDAKVDVDRVIETVRKTIRVTDTPGWLAEGSAIGVIFTELAPEKRHEAKDLVAAKVKQAMAGALAPQPLDETALTFQLYPDEWLWRDEGEPGALAEDRDLYDHVPGAGMAVKRMIDIAGSLAALAVLSPVFVAIAVAVKLTSRGPVIFRQPRIGQFGRSFTFLKFRSMTEGNDPSIHERYVKSLIAGDVEAGGGQPAEDRAVGGDPCCFKMRDDRRVTRVGKFLRKTSLDELPQFVNVLKGDMSLVGPRPPIRYEVDAYRMWHLRRLLAVKPGITGIWQVEGRSRVKFDDMVRMDLRYSQHWSIWLDLKILWRTPWAVAHGGGGA